MNAAKVPAILTEHRVGQSSRESNCSSNLPPKQQRKLRNGKSLSSAKTPDSEPFLMPLRSRQMVLPLRCAAQPYITAVRRTNRGPQISVYTLFIECYSAA